MSSAIGQVDWPAVFQDLARAGRRSRSSRRPPGQPARQGPEWPPGLAQAGRAAARSRIAPEL